MSLENTSGVAPGERVRSVFKRILPPRQAAAEVEKIPITLTWQQWLVLFLMGALVIAVELRSHALMWGTHPGGQTFWTDHELHWELLLFGFVLPILGGLALDQAQRTAVERDRVARELELRQVLVAQIREARDRQELVDLVVTMPGTIATAERAWLLAQRPGEQQLDPFAQWERPGSSGRVAATPVSPAVCEACAAHGAAQGDGLLTCRHAHGNATRHCLWLSTESLHQAVLLFDVPREKPLDRHQQRLLADLAREMSLAIDSAALYDLEQRQVDAAHNERLRIGRNLHDTLGQNLAFLRLKLDHLSASALVAGHPEFQKEMARMAAVADEAYEQVRDTLDTLRAAQDPGLEESIRLYASEAAGRAGYAVHIHSSGPPALLSPRQSRQVLYIVREALNNVEKHAAAQHVGIHLQWRDDKFQLAVSDDGRGFHPQELDQVTAYGMTIMSERARSINANLAFTSTPGDGTEVLMTLPLPSGAPAPEGGS